MSRRGSRFNDAFNVLTGRDLAISSQRLETMEIELSSLSKAYDAIRSKGPGMMIPEPTGAGWGARFGEYIDDQGREFASHREPVGVRVTSHVATDVFDNWFKVEDIKGAEGDKDLDSKVQAVLEQFKVRQQLIRACDFERTYGTSVIVVGYNDVSDATKLRTPVTGSPQIIQLYAYSKQRMTEIFKVTDTADPRLGQPKIYKINQNLGFDILYNWTRIVHCATRLREHPFFGVSSLDPIWDDMTVYRNIRWGAGQTMFRVGGGFPVIKLSGTPAEVSAWEKEGRFRNLHQRTYMVMGLTEEFEFAGAKGSALNPKEYIESSVESISIGSSIPKVQLRGAQAGSLSGSETNLKEYYSFISSLQTLWNDVVKDIINRFIESKQIDTTATGYKITWNPSFTLSDIDMSRIALQTTIANKNRLSYQTVDEVRALDKLDPLPDQKGEVVPGLMELEIKLLKPQPLGATANPVAGPATYGDQITTAPKFVKVMLEDKIIALQPRVTSGEVDRETALELVKGYILDYQMLSEKAAIDVITERTGKPIQRLPNEAKDFYEGQADYYLKYFEKLLDDWLKVGGLND